MCNFAYGFISFFESLSHLAVTALLCISSTYENKFSGVTCLWQGSLSLVETSIASCAANRRFTAYSLSCFSSFPKRHAALPTFWEPCMLHCLFERAKIKNTYTSRLHKFGIFWLVIFARLSDCRVF